MPLHSSLSTERRSLKAIGVGLLALAAVTASPPASAAADTITSNNWSGYAAHGRGATFKHATATWRQPAATCSGTDTYSAFWVGIGGYGSSSTALEQAGTELDCTSGSPTISAWYELVPSPSHTVRMTIAAGDLIATSVAVSGHRVTVSLSDRTRHESFSRTITAADVDDTSAEWIAEAPSDCTTAGNCTTLPLADFGAIRFSSASATTTHGRPGSISSSLWQTTQLLLGYTGSGGRFARDAASAGAIPSALASGSTTFVDFYTAPSANPSGTGSGGTGGVGGPGGPGGGFGG
jgi:hypothetical protein